MAPTGGRDAGPTVPVRDGPQAPLGMEAAQPMPPAARCYDRPTARLGADSDGDVVLSERVGEAPARQT